ncbi:MAG: class I tRNA ligase family protein, partial [Candidatus Nanoarchaeia archaeon]
TIIGKKARVPLFDLEVPILSDERVQMEFGSGAVMVCTYGDKTDLEWQKKYNLPVKIVLTKDGKLNDLAKDFANLGVKEAKEKILSILKSKNLLKKQEKIIQNVGVCWRCKNPVELIPSPQWAIKILHLKEELLKIGREIKWVPEYHRTKYEDWVKGLSWDWIISRQRYYGVPIPVWYCSKCGEIILPKEKDLPVYTTSQKPKIKVCPKCGCREFKPEEDVFDTWMISSLTPQIVRGFNANSIPFDLRPQGYEIIRTWAFYTILKSYLHFNKMPWKNMMINGMVLDPKGKAMHKSLGNVINPLDLVEKYGSDALRYFASVVNIGEDAPFMEKELVRAQKLMIKIWNVARFVELWQIKPAKKASPKHIIDKWIYSRTLEVLNEFKKHFEKYDAVSARRILEQFFWHEFCDFYLEMIKHRLYSPSNPEEKSSAEQTLFKIFYIILQMFAIFLPHITEEIYQEIYKKYIKIPSIHLSQFLENEPLDVEALELGKCILEIVSEIRKYKASKGLGPGAELEKLSVRYPNTKVEFLANEIAKITRVKHLHIEKGTLGVF